MTDLNPYEEGLALELQEAKGLIKALQKALKDQSSVSDRLAEQLAAARRDAEEAEAYATELEANGLANRVAIMRLEARNARLVEALRVNAAILEAERNRTGGEPFTGKWSFAENEGRYTVSEALDLARATLAEIKGHDDE